MFIKMKSLLWTCCDNEEKFCKKVQQQNKMRCHLSNMFMM